jgi:hypothetical protein
MSPEPSEQALVARGRIEDERAQRRRRLALVCAAGGLLLAASSLLAWRNHPGIRWNNALVPSMVLKEVSHSIGLATPPAGTTALVAGLLALLVTGAFRRGNLVSGWVCLVAGAGAWAMSSWEFFELILLRKNYLDRQPPFIANHSPMIYAVGVGVWLAVLSSLLVAVCAVIYLRDEYRTWRTLWAPVPSP